jgi:hypothetical protein|tara:strand:+ start:672 stop:875 length:204 start_codon:yes stop_codon:yes gene_type:complete
MIFTRTNPFNGEVNTLDIQVTDSQLQNYANGALIQVAFPQLSADEREFIKTGITADSWDWLTGRKQL